MRTACHVLPLSAWPLISMGTPRGKGFFSPQLFFLNTNEVTEVSNDSDDPHGIARIQEKVWLPPKPCLYNPAVEVVSSLRGAYGRIAKTGARLSLLCRSP